MAQPLPPNDSNTNMPATAARYNRIRAVRMEPQNMAPLATEPRYSLSPESFDNNYSLSDLALSMGEKEYQKFLIQGMGLNPLLDEEFDSSAVVTPHDSAGKDSTLTAASTYQSPYLLPNPAPSAASTYQSPYSSQDSVPSGRSTYQSPPSIPDSAPSTASSYQSPYSIPYSAPPAAWRYQSPYSIPNPAPSGGSTYQSPYPILVPMTREDDDIVLYFKNAAEAEQNVKRPNWQPMSADLTIPTNDIQRQSVVLRLVRAMRGRTSSLDKRGPVYNNRWGQVHKDGTPKEFYDVKAMEKVCWDILSFAEKLHTQGPSVLPGHDVEFLKVVRKTSDWTFGERIDRMIELMSKFKGQCDKLMKGGKLPLLVAAPHEAIATSTASLEINTNRQKMLVEGQKLAIKRKGEEDEEEDDGNKKRARTEHVPNSRQQRVCMSAPSN